MDLSVVIPARNEEFLGRTIQDILEHIEADTEIIAILDGYLPDPPLPISERVKIIYNPEAVGQRAAANQAAKIARGKYLMKVDAHCAFDQGFDKKMLEAFKEVGDNVTMLPLMRNLHAFDWVCQNRHRRYQGNSGVCDNCGEDTTKDVVWIPKPSPQSVAYRFDKTMHFQYWSDWGNKHPEDFVETMSIQGSCFMLTKEKWFELDICSEEFNSWGQQGVEVACKTWLSGGRVLTYRKTWYAHMFRTKGGDFGFPYSNPQDKVNENREKSRQMFQKDQWPKAIHNFNWLLEKFNPPDWGISRGIIFYTDSQLDPKIAKPVTDQLKRIVQEKRLGSTTASLKRKLDWGDKRISFPTLKRSFYAMHKEILACLENSRDDIIFFCEADVLYHPSHFDFVPKDKETFYYNENVWLLRNTDGHALHYDVNQLSGLCVYKEAALTHFRERFKMVEEAFNTLDDRHFGRFMRNMGFEPFTHGRIPWKNQFKYDKWLSEKPNVDVKHGGNATGQRWRKDQYRNQKLLINWTESENWSIPGWDKQTLIAFQ